MNNYPQIPRKYLIAGGFALLIFIGIIILGFVIANQSSTFSKLQITNLSATLNRAPSDVTNALREQLYGELVATYQLKDDVVINDAVIRDDTVQFATDQPGSVVINTATFLIDVPSFEQTYRATLYWTADDVMQNPISSPVVLACPAADETNYPNVSCYIRNVSGVDQ